MNSGISTQEPKKDEAHLKVIKEAEKYTEFILSMGRSFSAEKDVITKIMDLKNKATHCLDMDWSYHYADYLRDGQPKPRFIDNSRLKKLVENKKASPEEDFVLVDELIWLIIINLYGGGPEIICLDEKIPSFEVINQKKEAKYPMKSTSWSSEKIPEKPRTPPKTEITEEKLKNYPDKEGKKSKASKNSLIVGISNNSYYCFINTALQCLLAFPQLNDYFLQEKYSSIGYKTKKSLKYTHAYQNFLSEVASASRSESYIYANNFKKMFRKNFSPYEMHDSQEFLRFLLSELQDEMNPPIPAKITKKFQLADFQNMMEAWDFYQKFHPSIVDELFAGQLMSEIVCPLCQKISNAYDPFLDLSLTIAKNTSNIYDCLELFCKKEMVEQYQCEGCKRKSKAYRNLRISVEPKILMVHFKRFKIYPRKMKLNDRVSYPLTDLKLEKFSNDKRKANYNLKAIALHSGNVDYGHYVAMAKRDEDWYYFDDEAVQKVGWKDVQNQEAYLLFYERDD